MKKIFFLFLVLMCALPFVARAESMLVFCESFDDQFKPTKVGDSFPGPGVSLILAQDKPFGKHALTVTVYKSEGNREVLLARESMDINPKWTAYGIRNLPMPGEGEYSVGFTTPEGETLAQANVRITGKGSETAPPQENVGGTLEQIFKKYAPK